MDRTARFALLLIAAVLVAAAFASAHPWRAATAAEAQVVAGNYIITFKPGVNPRLKANQKASAFGLQIRHVYGRALNGFAASVPPGRLKQLQNDPDVAAVIPDRRVVALSDQTPTGVRRSQADRNPISLVGSQTNPYATIDVAVIDTGIDGAHPDLNVAGGISCVPGEPSWDDLNGHGTHVAGTIGALDNGAGVVGVAPGVRLWAVRVLNAAGEGQFSDVVCGVDWVTANAGVIDVANMSLGGEAPTGHCLDGSLHQAVCRSVGAGVTYVVAAGNSAADAAGFVPASFEEVITVSAIQDLDGAPGGRAGNFLFADDAFAAFSNFGAPVDLAAPGFNIRSTWPGGTYFSSSGTSMASPHVAGAAAIVRYLQPGSSPASVKASLFELAWSQQSADGFTGDFDGFSEPLLNAGAIGGDPLPPPPPACELSAGEGIVGDRVTVTCDNYGSSESVRIYWDSTSTSQRGSFSTVAGSGTGSFTVPAASAGPHQVIVRGMTSGIELSQPFTLRPGLKTATTTGKVGSTVSLILSGFPANSAFAVTWDDGATPIVTGTTSATGGATVFPKVPAGVTGPHLLRASAGTPGPQSVTAEATFTVVPSISMTPIAGKVGSSVAVTLRGYALGETVDVLWSEPSSGPTKVAAGTATSLGTAIATFTVPDATKGSHQIEGIGSAGGSATVAYTVQPSLALSATTGTVGTPLTLTLSGYGQSDSLTVKWYDTSSAASTVTTGTASSRGAATFTLAIPEATGGLHKVEVVGTTGALAYAYFTINSAISLTPASGLAGSEVSAKVSGLSANESIALRWYTTSTAWSAVATAVASAAGGATVAFDVPPDANPGDHKVEASGGSSLRRASTNFAVGSSGPPPPVDPFCTLGQVSGAVGTSLAIACGNFARSEWVRLYWDNTSTPPRTSIWSGSAGGGSGSFVVPDAVAGEHRLIALGATSGIRVEQVYTVIPSIKLNATSGKVGATVTAALKGFAPGESVELTWDGSGTLVRVTTSSVGGASPMFAVPEATGGIHAVGAVGSISGPQGTTALSVLPSLVLSSSLGTVGSSAAVTLRGFGDEEVVTVRWYGGVHGAAEFDTTTVSALGSGSVSLTVPDATAGGHLVEGAGVGGSLAAATFTVRSAIALSTTTGTVGSGFDVVLTGFGEGESVTLEWYDTSTSATSFATLTASPDGRASGSYQVPAATAGLHRFQARGALSGGSAYVYFNVKTGLSLSPAAGTSGSDVTVVLTGYRAGETVNVKWFTTATASSIVGSGVTSPAGSATVSFGVPPDASIGDHKVEGASTSSSARATSTFTVEPAASGGSTSTHSVAPTVDVTVGDDFAVGSDGNLPPGWSVVSSSRGSLAVALAGSGGNARLNLSGIHGNPGDTWVIRDGAAFTVPDVQIKLHFAQSGSAAGVVVAWRGPTDHVAVLANGDADRLEVVEVAGDVVRTWFATADGSVAIEPGRDYWLRAETGVDSGGNAWISFYWSTDGQTFQPLGSVQGLANLAGGVGLTAGGANPPAVEVDDFVARRSQATAPVTSPSPEPAAPSDPAGSDTATEPSPTPEPAPTEPPSPTPEPAPTETPTPEPTATEAPTPEQPPATPTAAPSPTATPTPEPTGEGEEQPGGAGDGSSSAA